MAACAACRPQVIYIPSNDVSRGEEVVPYEPPSPSRGRHRGLWLLFRQPGRVTARPPASRKGFQVKQWAKDHGLGTPASGLFFWTTAPEEQ
jgi:protein FLOWERING LOCUS T